MGKEVGERMPENHHRDPRPAKNKKTRKREALTKAATTVGRKESTLPPPLPRGRNCPDYRRQFRKCGKYNHYASCCGARPNPQQEKPEEKRRGQVKKQKRG